MDKRFRICALLAAAFLLWLPGHAQQSGTVAGSNDKKPPAQNGSQSQSGSSSQSSSDSNAFPEAESEKAAQQEKKDAQQTPSADDPQQGPPNGPKPDDAQSSGGDNNAFPEEESRKAAADAKARAGDSGSNSSPGVSSSGDDNRRVNDHNGFTPNVSMSHIHGKDPLKEDVQVGTYYLESGNYNAAYGRFKEASTLHPESTDAIFGLAEAARHLHKNDEALNNYKLFLDIISTGSKARDARKALSSLEKAR